MNYIKVSFLGFLFISTLAAGSNNECAHTKNSFRCVVFVRNYDADTITFNIPGLHPLLGDNMSVRVKGIDTPELRTTDACEKKVGYKAKEFVSKLMEKARRIDLESIERGKYFRVVADVLVDGESLTKKLLAKKLGYPYAGGTKENVNWCKIKNTLEINI
mgnify:CR=1 FL=1